MRDATTGTTKPSADGGDGRALKIMAKSVYRELKNSGYSRNDVVSFTSAMLELVSTEIREGNDPSA